jgi:hypothetical protein
MEEIRLERERGARKARIAKEDEEAHDAHQQLAADLRARGLYRRNLPD